MTHVAAGFCTENSGSPCWVGGWGLHLGSQLAAASRPHGDLFTSLGDDTELGILLLLQLLYTCTGGGDSGGIPEVSVSQRERRRTYRVYVQLYSTHRRGTNVAPTNFSKRLCVDLWKCDAVHA